MSQIVDGFEYSADDTTSRPRDMLRVATATTRQVSVGIVGAGFAGLRCAGLLLQHGCKVTIFEARNRVGGRVAQSAHLGRMVDLGPNWIHGAADNPITEIAKATATQLHSWDGEQATVNTDGQTLSAEEADEYLRIFWDDGMLAEAIQYSREQQTSIDPGRSLHDFFTEKAKGLFVDETIDEAARKRKTFLEVSKFWGAYVGGSVATQSLRFFWLDECVEGENLFVAETYHKILDFVQKPAKERADIKLNCRVKGVVAQQHEDSSHLPASPCIETADGTQISFDEVVVTTPLGWLKRNQDVFKPPLTPRLAQAIDNVGYGTLDKVYITFPSAYWDNPSPGDRDAVNEAGSFDATSIAAAATASPQHPPLAAYPGLTQWLAPSYAPDTNPQHWDQMSMSMAALPKSCAHPTLLFYVYGDCSKHIAALIASSRTDADRDAALASFFAPYYSRLPNYRSSNADCQPKAILATAWAGDELAGYGSYCNFQVGLEKGDEDVEVMRQGMPERGVWFAGEHTAPFHALGTSTGAYLSGEGVAKRIAKAYGLKDKDD